MAVSVAQNDEDWQSERGVLACNRYMFENNIHTDVTFKMNNDENHIEYISVHQYVLISRSPVFMAMLCGPMAEHPENICIPDISAEVFKLMLGFIYHEDVELSNDTVIPLIYAAKKYMIPGLVGRCLKYLDSIICADNVCYILEQCLLFEEKILQLKCLHFIEGITEQILGSDTFLEISLETLRTILSSSFLSMHEIEIFRACVKWAETKCAEAEMEPSGENLRSQLGDALYHIHFPCMSLADFSNRITPTGILTVDECFNVYQFLAAENEHKPERMIFPTNMRCVDDAVGPLCCHFRFDSKLDDLYKKHSVVMLDLDRHVKKIELGLSFLPQSVDCKGRIVVTQGDKTVNLPYDLCTSKVVAKIDLIPGKFVIENYISQMRFRVGMQKFAMLLTRVECCEGVNLTVVASDAFSVLPTTLVLTTVN